MSFYWSNESVQNCTYSPDKNSTSRLISPLQSFMSTIPKMWFSTFFISMGSPREFPAPTKKAISSSKSSSLQGPKTGGLVSSGRVCPSGLRTGVPDTTTLEALPWYPTGRCFLKENNSYT